MSGRRRGRDGGGRRGRGGGNNRRGRGPAPAMPPPGRPGRGRHRDAIAPGSIVYVVKKEDQRRGRETLGTVSRLLTNSAYHPRGIKVMLADGVVGRVTRFGGDSVNDVSGGCFGGEASSSDEDRGPSNARTLADFLPGGDAGTNANNDGSPPANMQSESFTVDDGAMATLVSMNFDPEKAREALQISNNDVQEAVDYLVMDGYLGDG